MFSRGDVTNFLNVHFILNSAKVTIFRRKEKMNPNFSAADIPGKQWIDKIKWAFVDAAGGKNKDKITFDQWMNSKFRYLIGDKPLTDIEMKKIYDDIDANCDLSLQYDEIIGYLLIFHKGTKTNDKNKITIEHEMQTLPNSAKKCKITRIIKCEIIESMEQIVSLSPNALIFWDMKTLEPVNIVNGTDFSDFCCVPALEKIVICLKSRKILFYDIKSSAMEKYYMSATMATSDLQSLTLREVKSIARKKVAKQKDVILFNEPTAICCDPVLPVIYVGDSCGRIDAIQLKIQGKLSYELLHSFTHHKNTVTKLQYSQDHSCFVSSSLDATLVMFSYDYEHKYARVIHTTTFNRMIGITNFIYDRASQSFVIATQGHCFACFGAKSQIQTILDIDHSIASMTIVEKTKRKSYLVTVNSQMIFNIYKMPTLIPVASFPMGDYHGFFPPTYAFSRGNALFLGGSLFSKWSFVFAQKTDRIYADIITGISYSSHFHRVLTIDKSGEIIAWDLLNCTKLFSNKIVFNCDVNTLVINEKGRRAALGTSNGKVVVLSANSAQQIGEVSVGNESITIVKLVKMFGQSKFIICTERIIMLYDDLLGNNAIYIRSFISHTDKIFDVVVLKSRLLLSYSANNEIILWSITNNTPLKRFSLKHYVSCAADLPNTDDKFILCDEEGFINIMSLDSTTPLKSLDAFSMVLTVPITSLNVVGDKIVVGNFNGYIKYYNYNAENNELEELYFFRAAETFIRFLLLVEDEMLLSIASDELVNFWSLKDHKHAGMLGSKNKWKFDKISEWRPADSLYSIEEEHFKHGDTVVDEIIPQTPKQELKPVVQPRYLPSESTKNPRASYVKERNLMEPLDIGKVFQMFKEIDDQYLIEDNAQTPFRIGSSSRCRNSTNRIGSTKINTTRNIVARHSYNKKTQPTMAQPTFC